MISYIVSSYYTWKFWELCIRFVYFFFTNLYNYTVTFQETLAKIAEPQVLETSVLSLLFIFFFFTYLYSYSFLCRNIHQNCRTPSFGKKQWLGKWCRRWLNYISFSTTYLHFVSVLADSCLLYVREDHCPGSLIEFCWFHVYFLYWQ